MAETAVEPVTTDQATRIALELDETTSPKDRTLSLGLSLWAVPYPAPLDGEAIGSPHPSPSFCARPMRCSLPVAPLGISARKSIFRGVLNAARRSERKAP